MTFLTKAKNTVSSLALNYAKDTQGNFAIIAAVSLLVIVGGLAASIDIGSAVSAKQRLQDTTDQIALYAARSLETDPAALTAQAQDYFNFNYANSDSIITLNSIVRNGDTVTVDASSVVETAFAGVFGFDELPVRVSSSSSYADRGLDIALVLDSTGSMGDPSSGGGTKIETLRSAANDLIDQLDNGTSGRIRFSVVPFAQYVNVGTDNLNANWLDDRDIDASWAGCVGSRTGNGARTADFNGNDFPAIASPACNTPITPLTDNLDVTRVAVNGMIAQGFTYMPAGLAWGWRTLEGAAPFTEANNGPRIDRDKVIIMMTDGANTAKANGVLHKIDFNSSKADRQTDKLCDGIKDSDIQLYTIAYEVSETSTRRLLEGCASNADSYFDAQNAASLTSAFAEIAANLSVLRLTN